MNHHQHIEFETVIGLEVHAQLLTRSKIFCGCSTRFGEQPNTNVCPVCLGLPGAMPVLNREAVTMAVKAALALGCRVHSQSIFARKNYFYPDLPKGYQISQYDQPLAGEGNLEVLTGKRNPAGGIVYGKNQVFRIRRLHLEEDAGKSIHGESAAETTSRIDLNRAGVPLIEIVSEPDFSSSQEAYDYLTHVRRTLVYVGVCDGNMEEGSLRCDANVSVRPKGQKDFGTKIEIKNLNSFRFLQKALDYEIDRQIDIVKRGRSLQQETRLWDEQTDRTFAMRTKEEEHDYRYFPEPDLPPLVISAGWLAEIRNTMPELPAQRRERFVSQYGVTVDEALQLTSERNVADFYEVVVGVCGNPRSAVHWITGDLAYELKRTGTKIDECPIGAADLGALVAKVDSGEISGKMAKTVFSQMFSSGDTADAVIGRLKLVQISDPVELGRFVKEALEANPQQVAEYRAGREKLLGFFVGQVMKETKGQANPQVLNALLREALGN